MQRNDSMGSDFLYRELARQLAGAMSAGSLRVGDRIPSVRRLSAQHAVSISTAVQALRYLENQRLIEARPKSGFYVARPPRELPEPAQSKPPASAHYISPPSLMREYADSYADPKLIPLGGVLPDPSMFPAQRLARLLAATARSKPHLAVTFERFSSGDAELRRVIARRALDRGMRLRESEVIVTEGATEALSLAVRSVARSGDTIALESPTYFLFFQIIESLGMKALEIPTHPRSGLSLEALDLATQKSGSVRALLCAPTFSNPLGGCMPPENRKRLVELCAGRGIPIIEDDVFGEISFTGALVRPLKSWDKSGDVLLCSSFTKTVAPGLRVGWIAPGRRQRALELLKVSSTMFSSHLPQAALAQFVANGGYDHHLRKLRARLKDQAQQLRDAVAASFPVGTRVTRPEGGYVLWIELPANIDAVELFRRALQENIGIAPGPLFSSVGRFRNCIRLSFGHAWSRSVADAVARVGQLARDMLTANAR